METKIQQLKYRLSSAGVDSGEIEYIVATIMDRAQAKLANALEAGVSLAVDEAQKMKAKGFLGDIAVRPNHNGFEITTDSGNQDYSTPPFPMLDKLLAKGKTAKDGSTYRVVPIGGKSVKPAEKQKDVGAGIQAASLVKPKESLTDMTVGMARAFGAGARPQQSKPEITNPTGPVTFRTASSKQNSGSQWVIPARPADMSIAISNINSMMTEDINRAVDSAIAESRSEIDEAIRYYASQRGF
jgi:hypothetical protein